MYFSDFIIQELHSLININSLLNTTRYLEEYKKIYYYWEFNEKYSLKYYEDEDFYNCVNLYIPNTNKQLSIKIHKKELPNVNILGGVHKLDISQCKSIADVSGLGNIHSLNLSQPWSYTEDCHITNEDLKFLGNCHTLNISHCDKITDEGIKYLGNIHTLNLCGIDITNESIKSLVNVHTLHMGVCSRLSNGMSSLLRNLGVEHNHVCSTITITKNELQKRSTCICCNKSQVQEN